MPTQVESVRTVLGLNRKEFAHLLGVSERQVFRWELAVTPKPKGTAAALLTGIEEVLKIKPVPVSYFKHAAQLGLKEWMKEMLVLDILRKQ